MAITSSIHHPLYDNPTFQHGLVHGFSWFLHGDTPAIAPNTGKIVDFIRDNMLEPASEGFLDEKRLTDNAGFLVGWILACFSSAMCLSILGVCSNRGLAISRTLVLWREKKSAARREAWRKAILCRSIGSTT